MKTLLRSVVTLSLLSITGVCLAQAPVVDVQQQTDNSQASDSTLLTDESISSFDLERRLKRIEQIVDSRTESQQRMFSQIMDLQNDIDEMRGSLELHNHQLEKLLERQRELFLELDKRFAAAPQQDQSAQSVNGADPAPQNTGGSANSEASAQEAYQAAVNLILKDKNYAEAVPAFQGFLEGYPASTLRPNAHYWLGQLLFNEQNYDAAKEQFSEVANTYGSSPKRADSLLKLGLIEKAAGNDSAANELFRQVVSEYPNGTPARLASQQLGQ